MSSNLTYLAAHCRIEPYWIKATALRAAAPGAHAPGLRPDGRPVARRPDGNGNNVNDGPTPAIVQPG